MNTSYKRYYEPCIHKQLGISLFVGSLATFITYPIEFIKTRIQIRSELIGMRGAYSHYWGYNPFKELRTIHSTGKGTSQFFHGLDSALMARMSHLLVRNYFYRIIYDKFKPFKPHNDLTIREKSAIAAFAGSIAAVISNPFELAMVRQISQGTLKVNQRPGYNSAISTISTIMQQEGTGVLFTRGLGMSILKAIALNISLTGPFDFLNERLWITFGDVNFSRPLALIFASAVATVCSIPFDNIKTKIQKQLPDRQLNRINYQNTSHAIMNTIKVEGVMSPFCGMQSYFGKVLIYSIFTVYITDIFIDSMKKKAGLKEWQI